MIFSPLEDRVIVEPFGEEEGDQMVGLLYVPDTAKEKPTLGRVLRAGPGKVVGDGKIRPLAVKEGDVVAYGKYSGSTVTVGMTEVVFMRESDIMAIVDMEVEDAG